MTTDPLPPASFWDKMPRDAKRRLSPAAYKVLGAIVELLPGRGPQVVRVTNSALGSDLAMSEGTINRALKEIEAAGYIARNGGRGACRAIEFLTRFRGPGEVDDPAPTPTKTAPVQRAPTVQACSASARSQPAPVTHACSAGARSSYRESSSREKTELLRGAGTADKAGSTTTKNPDPPTGTLGNSLAEMMARLRRVDTPPTPVPALTPVAPPQVFTPTPPTEANGWTEGQWEFLRGLTPEERRRFDGLDLRHRNQILAGFEFGEDRAARREWEKLCRAAVAPPLPPPDAPTPEVILALSGPSGAAMVPLATQAILADLQDKRDARTRLATEALCRDVAAGNQDAGQVVEALRRTLERAEGPSPLKSRGAYFRTVLTDLKVAGVGTSLPSNPHPRSSATAASLPPVLPSNP